MLRRVARALRLGLLVVGCALLLWLPLSFLYAFHATGPRGGMSSSHAVVCLSWVYGTDPIPQWALDPVAQVGFDRARFFPPFGHVFPRVIQQSSTDETTDADIYRTDIFIPLWLLAFLCLAWPVTSFLLARRRRGRGFPVYWKATGHVGPAHISIIGSVETGASGRSHYCRVRGPDAAEALASFLRSRGVPVTVHRAGGEKRIIHFPDSLSIEQASVDLARYQSLLCEFPEFQPEPEYG